MKILYYLFFVGTAICTFLTACGPTEYQPTANDVGSTIRELDDFVTMEVSVQKVVMYDSDKEELSFSEPYSYEEGFKSLFGRRLVFLTVPAKLNYGYDLRQVELEEKEGKLTIHLPKSPIYKGTNHESQVEDANVVNYATGFRDKIGTSKIQELRKDCVNKIVKESNLILSTIDGQAKISATNAVAAVMKGTRWEKDYEIKFDL